MAYYFQLLLVEYDVYMRENIFTTLLVYQSADLTKIVDKISKHYETGKIKGRYMYSLVMNGLGLLKI
ncbi:MAG: hypothetical protein ACTSRA_19170 [Promethearchaeota archaeon]